VNGQDIGEYYATERPELVAFLRPHGPFGAALDIGCAAGVFGEALLGTGLVDVCDGVEPHGEAARLAEARLRRVWHGSLDAVSGEIPWRHYDLVVFADVLEHLTDPWAALRRLRDAVAPGCRLLVSVPNIRHYKVSLPLLCRGEFRYEDSGIMDRTHLHFFTRASLEETLHECGWTVRAASSHMKKRYRRWYMPTRLLEPFVAVQHLVLAEPS
jgi:2-polyprenyl-3-methyl-5-hydroxy-6-metoxy-1,4-benzoquinol methylase